MVGLNSTDNFKQSSSRKGSLLAFVSLALSGFALIAAAVYFALPSIKVGLQNWSAYLNVNWAHQEDLIAVFINFCLMVWVSFSALFFGSWLLRRSMRKLQGRSWSLASDNGKKIFFPPILLYLKCSCLYFVIIFLFVILQYPLQFILYSN